jgi:short-subunit dehydrogenase
MSTTLITGASSGIGESFARKLAARGENLLLTARSEKKLASLCDELSSAHKIDAQYVAIDLTEPGAPARLFEETKNRNLTIDLLINNAGFGSAGDFMTHDLQRELKMIDLNIKALVELTYRFLGPMRERRSGAIMNVASTAAFQPVPYMTTYAATKAFVLSFTEGLWEENRAYGVKMLAVCPGVTQTNFFEAAGIKQPPMRVIQQPDEVVDTALRALRRSGPSVVSGWSNYIMVASERLVPRSLIARVAGAVMRGQTSNGG